MANRFSISIWFSIFTYMGHLYFIHRAQQQQRQRPNTVVFGGKQMLKWEKWGSFMNTTVEHKRQGEICASCTVITSKTQKSAVHTWTQRLKLSKLLEDSSILHGGKIILYSPHDLHTSSSVIHIHQLKCANKTEENHNLSKENILWSFHFFPWFIQCHQVKVNTITLFPFYLQ